MKRENLNHSDLMGLLRYDAKTGDFFWRDRGNVPGWHGALNGKKAGHVNKAGYRVVVVNGVAYKAHRLAWFYMHGKWPSGVIDHIDGDSVNNRLSNLRDVTHAVNMKNRRSASANTRSGLLGVRWRSNRSRWVAEIYIDGKPKRVGSFTDKHEAHLAYLAAKRKYHEGCSI